MTALNTSPSSAGIVTDPITRNDGSWSEGLANYSPPLSAVLGAAASDAWNAPGGLPSLIRSLGRDVAASGVDPSTGMSFAAPAPVLSAKDANQRYGIEGHLKFDADTPEPVAAELNDLKRAELVREDVAQRSPGGLVQGAATLGTQLVVSALDPLNVAASFIPVVGEARMASWLARAGESAVARAGVRAGAGAIEGAAGQLALAPLAYGVSRQEQSDLSMVDELVNLAVGGALGAGLHAGVGLLADRFRPRLMPTAEGEPAPTLGEKIAAAPVETREAAMRAAVGQLAAPAELGGGEVNDIEAVIRAEASRLNVDHLLSSTAVPAAAAPPAVDFALPSQGRPRGVTGRTVSRPLDINEFLAAQGGLAPVGELAGMGLDRTFVPGYGRLVREGGLPLDEARARAEEAGYIGGGVDDYQTTDTNHLLDALDRQARGDRVFSLNDLEAVQDRGMQKRLEQEREREAEALADVHATAKEHGVTLTDDEARELGAQVRQGREPLDALSELLERTMYGADREAAEHAKAKGTGNGFDIPFEPEEPFEPEGPFEHEQPFEPGRQEEAGRAPQVEGEPPARPQQAAEGGTPAPGKERGRAGEDATGSRIAETGPVSKEGGAGGIARSGDAGLREAVEENPALATALEASRQAEADLENMKAAGHVTGEEEELLQSAAEDRRAEQTARGYDAAGACLARSA